MDKLLDTSFITQFDFIILSLILVSIVLGFFKGFVRSAISFVGIIIAVALAVLLSDLFSDLFVRYVDSHSAAIVLSTIMLLVIFLGIVFVANSIIFSFIKSYCGSAIDKSFGVCFGFVRGCVLLSFAFYLLVFAIPEINV